jgi:hypothetical protein
MVELSVKHLSFSGLGAVLVIAGIIIKNTYEQLGRSEDPIGRNLGLILLIGGWLVTAYATSLGSDGSFGLGNKTLMSFGAAIAVLISIMEMKRARATASMSEEAESEETCLSIWPLIFAAGLFGFGYVSSMERSQSSLYLGVGGAIAILLANMLVLPWQRRSKVTDGPGMPLLCMGWLGISFANSILA